MITAFVIQWIAFPIISFCLVASAIRLAKGPSAVDRVMAFDLIVVSLTGIIILSSIFYKQLLLLDMMVVLTLLSFLGTVGFAVYLGRSGGQDVK